MNIQRLMGDVCGSLPCHHFNSHESERSPHPPPSSCAGIVHSVCIACHFPPWANTLLKEPKSKSDACIWFSQQ